MRKNPYQQNKPKPHMLIVRTLANTDMEILERSAVNAFTHGVAKTSHFDLLLRMMNLLLVAGQTDAKRKYALDYAQNKIKPALTNIRARFEYTNKLGVNAQELKTLKEMVDFNREFWLRQPSELFLFATEQVDAFYKELHEKNNARTN
jgi:hypothetical protein